MTTKTTDLWLSRDPNGDYWASEKEPFRQRDALGDWWWDTGDGDMDAPTFYPVIRKGTKRRIRVTVEVLR